MRLLIAWLCVRELTLVVLTTLSLCLGSSLSVQILTEHDVITIMTILSV